MKTWDELPLVNGEDWVKWNNLMAKYQHQGCPGIGMEDICSHATDCATKGRCRISYEKAFDRNQQSEINKGLPPDQRLCVSCRKRPVEIHEPGEWDDGPFVSNQCGGCNDRDAQQYREEAEFRHYHPD